MCEGCGIRHCQGPGEGDRDHGRRRSTGLPQEKLSWDVEVVTPGKKDDGGDKDKGTGYGRGKKDDRYGADKGNTSNKRWQQQQQELQYQDDEVGDTKGAIPQVDCTLSDASPKEAIKKTTSLCNINIKETGNFVKILIPRSNPNDVHVAVVGKISDGTPVIRAGAGTGISAKFEEAGGVDFIVMGSLAGLLPFGDANDIVLQMANEVLPVVKGVPVLARLCATDPFRRMEYFLRQLESIGFCGVQNFPTVGLFDGNFRHNLEETGMGMEVEMISMAHRMGFLTTPYVFNPDEADAMAKAGAHIIVAHMGLTTAGSIGAMTAATLDDSVLCVQAIADAAFGVKLISLFSITEPAVILLHFADSVISANLFTNTWTGNLVKIVIPRSNPNDAHVAGVGKFLMFPRELQLSGESVKLMKLVEAAAKGTINNETLGYFT
ncbi:Uncharacterized protein y4oV [Zea mays]|uniref:Uncharacterized protein y4oV n=1 Tax=Zea mays TaxID=4577 RepID=A0A3L6EWK2_MAIZE|nr:Uncharacterized protein y4oV [Zea mays]